LKAIQELRCTLRMTRGREDRVIVVLQHLKPVRDVIGVVVARHQRDCEIGAHPGTIHAVLLQQVERWLAGATTNPNEASKKVKLKMLLMKG
jgi:hypothetical protein